MLFCHKASIFKQFLTKFGRENFTIGRKLYCKMSQFDIPNNFCRVNMQRYIRIKKYFASLKSKLIITMCLVVIQKAIIKNLLNLFSPAEQLHCILALFISN